MEKREKEEKEEKMGKEEVEKGITFIILGATGDLAKRKLLPAIYKLLEQGKLSNFAIIGVARRPFTAARLLNSSRQFLPKIDLKTWRKLQQATYYEPLEFYQERDFIKLKKFLPEVERKHRLPGNRLFYLATLPQHFDTITLNLARNNLAVPRPEHWPRVVFEKPFGDDLRSARLINAHISRLFPERQIYRIDHYLGKELVGNIALVRFTNRILEPLWNNQHIHSVQIILSEQLGMEGRGNFYDQYGALKDVVQSHLLQMLALVAMEAPRKLTGDDIRNEKAKILRQVQVKDVLLGQYAGYRKEEGVQPHSETETFAALHLEIEHPRWQGVPFYLKTGKALDKKETSIHLKFKMVDCLLTHNCPADSNYLTIRVQPNEGIIFEMNAKVPGETYQVTPIKMEFCHSCLYGPTTPEAYEQLLVQVIKGDQSVFVRNDEIEAAWKIVDEIERRRPPLYSYKPGSKGPGELEEWNKKHRVRWRA